MGKRQKTGWLFLTSTVRFRERLLPVSSLWLDTPVLLGHDSFRELAD
jgi:hypothetical protein